MATRHTPRGELIVLDDPAAIARAGAERLVDAAKKAIAQRGRFTVALAGGSTPKAMNTLLASEYKDRVDWSKVEIFFGDERCVPPDHKDSNYRMTRESLLDQVPIPADRVHRIAGEKDPKQAAEEYEATLRRALGQPSGFPRIDLVFLGMGPDGHTASLFPGTTALVERQALVTATFVQKLDAWRVTMSAPMLSAAGEVIVQAGGAEKADNLKVALESDRGAVPISLVQPHQMIWLVDRAASSKLG